MGKTILYVGNGVQIENSAPFLHARNMAKLLYRLGYNTVFICPGTERRRENDPDTFEYWQTKQYITIPKVKSIEYRAEELFGLKLWNAFRKAAKIYKPEAVILYGAVIESRLIGYCKEHAIPLILERVDWFEKDDYASQYQRFLWKRNTEKCYTKLDFRADGVIAISDYLYKYYKRRSMEVVQIPPIFDVDPIDSFESSDGRQLRLVYAGSFAGMKDSIAPAILSVMNLNRAGRKIVFDIVGVNAETISAGVQTDEWSKLGITAHGHCEHGKAIQIIQQADFSILLRQNKRYAKAGFSTKFAESMMQGVPVFCTRVGGADSVIEHGIDGWLIENNEVSTITAALESIVKLPRARITAMKRNAYVKAERLFSIDSYTDSLRVFLQNVTKEAGKDHGDIITKGKA